MKKFMIVGEAEGEQFTSYADTYAEAKNKATDIECGLGGYAEIYSREQTEHGAEYRFLEA